MSDPITVDEFLAKADPPSSEQPIRLLVVLGSSPDEQNVSEWMADEAIAACKAHSVEVAKYHLPKLRVHPCVNCYGGGGRVCMHPCDRNDIESDIYRPDDQMQTIYDQMIAADMLLVATDVRWSGINHYTQRFFERLNPFVNQAAAGKPLLKKKVAGVIVVGDGAVAVAGIAMSVLNAVGYSLSQYGYAAWHVPRSVSADQAKAAYERSKAVHDDVRLLSEGMLDYTTRLRGE
jgi:multimeric flavodoxin WrbA